VIVGHPLDSAKVIIQTYTVKKDVTFRTPGLFETFRNVISKNGYRGLYAGVTPALAANMTENGLLFFTYGKTLSFLDSHVFPASGIYSGEKTQNTFARSAIAGSIAAAITSTAICPIELFKCRKQVAASQLSIFDIAADVFKHKGIQGFFRGMVPTLCREVPGNFAFFGTYQGLSEVFQSWFPKYEKTSTLMAGGFGGMAFWLVAQPADTIKSNMQVIQHGKYGNMNLFTFCRTFHAENGISGFYRGIIPVLLRAFLANAALFLTVEESKKLLTFS